MTKTQTSTGLVRIEYHGQVWFERPGVTEIIFKRLHIEQIHVFPKEGAIAQYHLSSPGRNGCGNNSKYDEDS